MGSEQEPRFKKKHGMQTFMESEARRLEQDLKSPPASELSTHPSDFNQGFNQSSELNLQQMQGSSQTSQMGDRDSGGYLGYSSPEEYERAQRAMVAALYSRNDRKGLETTTDRVLFHHQPQIKPKE